MCMTSNLETFLTKYLIDKTRILKVSFLRECCYVFLSGEFRQKLSVLSFEI